MQIQNSLVPSEIFSIIENNLDRKDQIALASTCSVLRKRGVATDILPPTVDPARVVSQSFASGYQRGHDGAPEGGRNVGMLTNYVTRLAILPPAALALYDIYNNELNIKTIIAAFTLIGIHTIIQDANIYPEQGHSLGNIAIIKNIAGNFFGSLQAAKTALAWGWSFGLPAAREALDMAYGNDNNI